jgi:hypothetical protein
VLRLVSVGGSEIENSEAASVGKSRLFLALLLAHRAQVSAAVVTLRERKACSLIAPPIVGRAIADARSMRVDQVPNERWLSRGSLRWL